MVCVCVIGTLLGFKFYSFRVLPLTVGIYRPTGGTCAFTLIALYTPSVQETGVITVSVHLSDSAVVCHLLRV